jgi:hypothetical protein
MTVPGEQIAVSQTPSLHGLQQDLDEPMTEKRFEIEAMRKDGQVVIRQAFDVARRRLQDYARRRRRGVKNSRRHTLRTGRGLNERCGQ